MAVPYTFGSATTSIPLSQLDSNFATAITLGNTAVQLGNTITTLTGLTSVTTSADSTISGLTVGKGAGSATGATAVGASALQANTSSGVYNTAIGFSAMYSNTSATRNTVVGAQALYTNTTGEYNCAFGLNSLQLSTTSSYNAGFGYNSLNANTTGANNTGIGSYALNSNTTASNNTAVGYQALYSNTGTQNTAIGAQALYSNTSSVNSTAVGYQAGQYNTASGNIFIGQGAGTTRATTGEFNILIGATAQNSATGGAYEIVIGTNNPTGKGGSTGFITAGGGGVYQGNNSAAWSVASDRRLKKNIVDNTEGLDIISQIRVRNFEYRTAEEVTELPSDQAVQKQGIQLGVIAQELLEVCGDCVKTESTGVMSVNSDNLTWHMINAIKDLKALVNAQATEITALKAKVGI
jgi:hypothetical protein